MQRPHSKPGVPLGPDLSSHRTAARVHGSGRNPAFLGPREREAVRVPCRVGPEAASVSPPAGHESLEGGQDETFLETFTKLTLGSQYRGGPYETPRTCPF